MCLRFSVNTLLGTDKAYSLGGGLYIRYKITKKECMKVLTRLSGFLVPETDILTTTSGCEVWYFNLFICHKGYEVEHYVLRNFVLAVTFHTEIKMNEKKSLNNIKQKNHSSSMNGFKCIKKDRQLVLLTSFIPCFTYLVTFSIRSHRSNGHVPCHTATNEWESPLKTVLGATNGNTCNLQVHRGNGACYKFIGLAPMNHDVNLTVTLVHSNGCYHHELPE